MNRNLKIDRILPVTDWRQLRNEQAKVRKAALHLAPFFFMENGAPFVSIEQFDAIDRLETLHFYAIARTLLITDKG
ncbi:hypothetical protein J23TS9_37300 [Paenibacillus sp. J23TS9]|nr:hypothetical protein J23TS9_37300 [Paenibacillus sp. J23TS9]